MISCSACSKENADDARHCGFCGAQIGTEAPKKTMFGMAAVPAADLARIKAEAAARRAGLPAPSPPAAAAVAPTAPAMAAAQAPGAPERAGESMDIPVAFAETMDASKSDAFAEIQKERELDLEFDPIVDDVPASGESMSALPAPSALPDGYSGGAPTGKKKGNKLFLMIAIAVVLLVGVVIVGAALAYVLLFREVPMSEAESSLIGHAQIVLASVR